MGVPARKKDSVMETKGRIMSLQQQIVMVERIRKEGVQGHREK